MDLTAWMEQWHMLPPAGGIVLCAVSGGRDSVCLLHYLHSISERCGFSVAVGHYNHHMRPTAQRDEDFVRELCGQLNVPFYTDGCDVVAAAEAAGCGVEEMGRRLRYAFLERLADEIGAARIATAHHQADQAETVLLNLLRGTGPEGLGGIPPVRGRLIRPLLRTPREEIEGYLEEHGLGHVEDETNESLAFSRNRLRRCVLPELEKINPALRRSIARTAEIMSRENRYLDELASQYLPTEGTGVPRQTLLEAPEALQPRMVRLLLDRLGTGKKDVSAAHIDAVLTLCRSGGMTDLPGGAAAICRGGVLRLERKAAAAEEMTLREGENIWGEWCVTVTTLPEGGMPEENALYLSAALVGTLQVGPWRGGEGLQLPHSRGRRSIKRLLTERGIPPEERTHIPCIRSGGTAAAVYGLGTDINYLPEEKGRILEITFEKRENHRRTDR